MKNNRRGFTLFEVLISSAVFLIILATSVSLFANGWKYFRYGSSKTDQISAARKIINKISEDVSMSDKIYAPNNADDLIILGRGFISGNNLLWKVTGYNAQKTVNNMYNIYQADYPANYSNGASATSQILLDRGIKDYSFNVDAANSSLYNISFTITVNDSKAPDFKLAGKILRKK